MGFLPLPHPKVYLKTLPMLREVKVPWERGLKSAVSPSIAPGLGLTLVRVFLILIAILIVVPTFRKKKKRANESIFVSGLTPLK